jgi:hypothetical protein
MLGVSAFRALDLGQKKRLHPQSSRPAHRPRAPTKAETGLGTLHIRQRLLGLAHTGRIFPGPPNPSSRPKYTTTLRRKSHQNHTLRPDRQSLHDSNNIAKMADSDSPVTLRTRKFIRNPLLGRKQMVV